MSEQIQDNPAVEQPEAEVNEQDIVNELSSQVAEKALDRVVKSATDRILRRNKAPAVPVNPDDKSLNDWLHLVGMAGAKNPAVSQKAFELLNNKYNQQNLQETFKAMSQGTDTAGGFTVPSMYSSDLLGLEGFDTIAFDRVQKYDIAGMATQYFPVRDQSAVPSTGDSAFLAGVTVGTVTEGNAPAATTQPAFKQLALTPQKYSAEIDVTYELVQNSLVDITGLITQLGREVIIQRVEYGIFNGDGSNLTGIIGHASTVDVKRQTTNSVTWQDVRKMYVRFVGNRQRACWVCGPLVYDQLLNMQDGSNRLIWVPNVNSFATVAGAPLPTLLGIPVVLSQYTPALGTTGDLMLIDFAADYALGVNRMLEVQASQHYKFSSQIITYLATWRGGGKPKYTAPVTLSDGTTKVGVAIQLDSALS